MKNNKKAALHNLGCKVNQYETDAMEQMLREEGYEIVAFDEPADVYVVNTCSVTNVADQKSRQMLHRTKKMNPDSILVAAGCYVQTAKEKLQNDPDIDILIGNDEKHKLIPLLREFEEKHFTVTSVKDLSEQGEPFEELMIPAFTEHTRAFLKVQDGCNQFCSYCIIPYARGRIRSRGIAEAVAEATKLAACGYKEMVLTGIHLSSYGDGSGKDLLALIKAIAEVPGVERVRLGSLEPRLITEEFTKELAEIPEVCPHFHLSLQSGSDTVLSRMNRHYTADEYAQGCDILRRYFDAPAITTDIIVGFPGESEAEFEETMAFARRIGFAELHVFKFSARRGTRAEKMPGQLSDKEKSARSERLIALGNEMTAEYISRHKGKKASVLLEEIVTEGDEEKYIGFTKEYIRATVPADGHTRGEIVEIIL